MSTPIVVFLILAVVTVGTWAVGKYREFQAQKQSEELRALYASVHAMGARQRQ